MTFQAERRSRLDSALGDGVREQMRGAHTGNLARLEHLGIGSNPLGEDTSRTSLLLQRAGEGDPGALHQLLTPMDVLSGTPAEVVNRGRSAMCMVGVTFIRFFDLAVQKNLLERDLHLGVVYGQLDGEGHIREWEIGAMREVNGKSIEVHEQQAKRALDVLSVRPGYADILTYTPPQSLNARGTLVFLSPRSNVKP